MHPRFIRISERRALNLAQVVEVYWEGNTLVLVTTAVNTVRDEDDPEVFLTIPHLIALTGEDASRVWAEL